MYKSIQSHPKLSFGLFFCAGIKCVQQIMILLRWMKPASFRTI
jgi:hypothetical protein